MDEIKRQPAGSLLRSSAVVSSMTMISRVFGLARDMVIAYLFGSGAGADAFFLAFRIPNLFRRLFAEGAFSQGFVPVLSEYKSRRTHAEVKALVDRTWGTLGVFLLLLTLAGVLGAEVVISVFAPGYLYHGEAAKFALAVEMLRLTFPYLMLISLTAVAGGILNTYGRFAVPAFTPVLLNVSLIGCALVMHDRLDEPVMALAYGVLIAGVAQLTFQFPSLIRIRLMPRPLLDTKDEGVRRIMTLMLPAIFGASVSQINLMIDTLLASFLETGSLSWLYYSDRLLELPLALFGITIATVILPGLSREHAESTAGEFNKTLNWAVQMVILFGLPATVALVLMSEELIATLFYQGEMSRRDVSMAGLSLAAYGAGLLGHMLVKVLAPGYFARQDTKTPVKIGVVAMLANVVLNLLLIAEFRHAGLALATSLSAFLNAGLLFVGLKRGSVFHFAPGWLKFLAQVLFACSAMTVFIVYIMPPMPWWFDAGFVPRLGSMLLICAAGAVIYGAALILAGARPARLVR